MSQQFPPAEYVDMHYVCGWLPYGGRRWIQQKCADPPSSEQAGTWSYTPEINNKQGQWFFVTKDMSQIVPLLWESATCMDLGQRSRVCLIYLMNPHGQPQTTKVYALIVWNVCRHFNRMVSVFMFRATAGCFIPYSSLMMHSSFRMELTIHEILTCGLPMVLTGPFRAPVNIDSQRMTGETWRESCWQDHSFGIASNHCELFALPDEPEDVRLETRLRLFFGHDGAPPHFVHQVTTYMNQRYRNRWIGYAGLVLWPPKS
jgi:hypothetical protein